MCCSSSCQSRSRNTDCRHAAGRGCRRTEFWTCCRFHKSGCRNPSFPSSPSHRGLKHNRVVNLAWSLLQRQCVVGSSKTLVTSVTQCMPMHLKRMSPENYSSERKQKLICFLTISSYIQSHPSQTHKATLTWHHDQNSWGCFCTIIVCSFKTMVPSHRQSRSAINPAFRLLSLVP